MGTGVLSPIFSALALRGFLPEVSRVLALAFLILAIIIAIPVLGVTTWRWIRYTKIAGAELANPVKGAMSVTYAGAFLVLAVGFGRAGMTLFGAEVATFLTYLFTAIGGTLALLIGIVFLTDIFVKGSTPAGMISGAWFIPPVVTIIVPIALRPLMTEPSALANELFWLSWMFLGIGTLLYFAIVAMLFFRSTTVPLPPAPLAPSLIIGMGPAGLVGFDLLILAEISESTGQNLPALVDGAAFGGAFFWGFGLWWGIASLIVILRGYKKLPFVLSWWAFTFPLGAWVVSGINIGSAINSAVVVWISLLGLLALLVIWAVVFVRTLIGVANGSIWEH